MSMPRRLEPEWLDELAADDPRAIRARQDLERVNRWMLNARLMANALLKNAGGMQPRTIVDLGSGDGQFMHQVARRLAPHWPNVALVLQDQQDIVSAATRAGFAALGWSVEVRKADVFEFLAEQRAADVITSNLFLHHFDDQQLARLFGRVAQSTQLFVACEPRRAKFVVRASRLLWVIGCNDVSIHDAIVSARAGFDGNELSALWPHDTPWQLHEYTAGFFSHCFAARRVAPTATLPGTKPQG
jgi:hypothetical protein